MLLVLFCHLFVNNGDDNIGWHYKDVCKRMKAKGFHSGFACLFYGSPGTGKTETAYQLAKATGRDVMLVDIPQIRSKWVGESEKNLRGILIATTNLQTSMDKAFERRFLYKIQFERPNLEARANIWHSMIPDLDKSVINSLASKYDFTGGQIESMTGLSASPWISELKHG